MKMCHMVGDTEDELHQMADRIGVSREHYHAFHYNICLSKRLLAVQNGAVRVTTRQAVIVRRALERKMLTPEPAPVILEFPGGHRVNGRQAKR